LYFLVLFSGFFIFYFFERIFGFLLFFELFQTLKIVWIFS
jgi:hypothetical protein